MAKCRNCGVVLTLDTLALPCPKAPSVGSDRKVGHLYTLADLYAIGRTP